MTDSQTGEHIGTLRRKGWSSLFRDSWEILDADGIVRGRVTEDSAWKAAVRRMIELASLLLPQTFHIEVDGQIVGTMRQNFNLFVQKFDVDLTHDAEASCPGRSRWPPSSCSWRSRGGRRPNSTDRTSSPTVRSRRRTRAPDIPRIGSVRELTRPS